MRLWQPIFIENSKIPVWLSKIAPIEISAITLGFFVLSKDTMSEETRRHETIHFQQFLELGIVGFVVLYFWYWLKNLASGMDGSTAYYEIPFEKEAYENHANVEYLIYRKRYSWIHYRKRT